jgi:ACS family hexuronate transporter-like MFS transporter
MSSDTAYLITALSVVLMVVSVVAAVFFLLSLQRALELCAPQNRTLAPGKVWLCFIPLFNLVWIFVVVTNVASSLRLEFESRHAPPEDYGRSIGLAYCILAVTSIIPLLGLLTGLASFVCGIIYWVKISAYSRTLEQTGPYLDGGPAQEFSEVEEPFNPGKAWLVLAILMFAYAAQHLQTIGLSWFVPTLRDQFRLTSSGLGLIFSVYMIGLIAGYILMTVVTALWGTRWGLTIALAGVSLAAAGSGLASGAGGMMVARALAGFFAGGLLPAAIQSLRECFPAPMRPLAIGFFLASSPVVTLLISPLVRHIIPVMGWRTALPITGIPTAISAAICWFVLVPPSRRAGSAAVSSLAVVSVVMLAVGVLLTTPLYAFAQSWLPYLVRRGMGASMDTLPAINLAAAAGGAILAGGAAWAMMRAGASPWKTRAALLTLFGLILPVAAVLGIYAKDRMLMVVSALIMGAFQGWSTLLYAAVADTLPARGVGIGVAIGAFMAALVLMLMPPVLGSLTSEYGAGFGFGVSAALAAAGLLCVGLLAWLVRPKPTLLPAAVPAAA